MSNTISVMELRNTLMEQHGWDRRVATLAARYYLGVDRAEDFEPKPKDNGYGESLSPALLTQSEFREICRWR